MAESSVQHDVAKHLFYIGKRASPVAYLEYRLVAGHSRVIDLTHTFTAPAGRGKGFAALLATAAFEFAKTEGYRVIPTCSYISQTFLHKHPELNSLVQSCDNSNNSSNL